MKVCSVEECNNRHEAKGFCSKHYQRFVRNGTSDYVGIQKGEKHHLWKGESAGYVAMHERVRKERGWAKEYQCPCGQVAEQWSYDHSDPEERWQYGVPYSLDVMRYSPMCTACHKKFDMTFKATGRLAGKIFKN